MTDLTQLGLPYTVHLWLLVGCCAVVWVVCGIISVGMTRAYFWHVFQDAGDWDDWLILLPTGLVGLLAVSLFIAQHGSHGLMFHSPKTAQSERD